MLPEFPHLELEKVCVDKNPEPMRALGLKRYPAIASGEQTFSALFFTKGKIRRFLDRL